MFAVTEENLNQTPLHPPSLSLSLSVSLSVSISALVARSVRPPLRRRRRRRRRRTGGRKSVDAILSLAGARIKIIRALMSARAARRNALISLAGYFDRSIYRGLFLPASKPDRHNYLIGGYFRGDRSCFPFDVER